MITLSAHAVSKGFGPLHRRTEVLHDIHLQIEQGEFVAIIGYSGAGKTTLVSLLCGLLKPDMGEIHFDGKINPEPGPDRGVVFQNYSLLPWLSVSENIALAVNQVHPDWTPEKRKEHVATFVEMVNLTPAKDKLPRELSGGMRQRVSVARTMAIQPKVLLLDEPLSALDALTRANLQDEIARIRHEHRQTVLLITNDPDEAILLADRVIPLTEGPKATLGPSIPIHLPHPRQRRTLAENPEFKRIRTEIVDYLLDSRRERKVSSGPLPILPDIQPEDISLSTNRFLVGRRTAVARTTSSSSPSKP